MSTELALSRQSLAIMPVYSSSDAAARANSMAAYIRDIMTKDVDYGVIPGTNKPSLYKAGAEKLSAYFGLAPRFSIVEKVEDWTGKEHGGEMLFYYQYKCTLYRGDMLIAEGEGSCNSWESKYRYRWVSEDQVPVWLDKTRLTRKDTSISETDFGIKKSETTGKWGKPAEYWQRFKDAIADGTAVKIKKQMGQREFDGWAIPSTSWRIPNDDAPSQVNTVQKMAAKRALVAAVLIALGVSNYFSQDLEDMDIVPSDWNNYMSEEQVLSNGAWASVAKQHASQPTPTNYARDPQDRVVEVYDATYSDRGSVTDEDLGNLSSAPPQHAGNAPQTTVQGGGEDLGPIPPIPETAPQRLDPRTIVQELEQGVIRTTQCKRCSSVVAYAPFTVNGVKKWLGYNKDGHAHPARCGTDIPTGYTQADLPPAPPAAPAQA